MQPIPQLLCAALAASPFLLSAASQAPASSAPAGATRAPEALLVALDQAPSLPLSGPVMRQRVVAVRADLLADAAGSGAVLALEPFAGERLELARVQAEAAYGGGTVYRGDLRAVEGEDSGTATIVVLDDAVSATLRVGHRLLEIESAGGGAQRVLEIDESRMPTCGVGEAHRIPPTVPATGGAGAGASKAAATNHPTIDILVVYTPQARAAQGGTNAMLALIDLAIAESNQGYANSDVGQRMRLVYAYEAVGYTETGDFGTELARLRSKTDGYLDDVHALRDQYGADACSLIVNSTQYCGIAYVMGTPSQGFESSAFQVTARTCATGYYSFAHEFGHNFGCQHDKANAGTAYYPWAYGWRTANGAWRTVMAYAPGTRIDYWSNPGKSYSGQVLGKAGEAENFRALNDNAPVTSQWRCAVPENYCQAKFTSTLSYPTLGWSGKPVADGSGAFAVRIQDAEPNKSAIVFYGPASDSAPFGGGTLCVAPPLTRLPAHVTDASGAALFSFPITQFQPGDEVYVQGWFRDPAQPDGTGIGLTDGLRVDVCLYGN